MQNEIRAPKSGTIDRLAVVEGQTVNAGEVVPSSAEAMISDSLLVTFKFPLVSRAFPRPLLR